MNIELINVSYIYNKGNPFEKLALDDINLTIKEGEFLGIIGHTGSGKSTLLQHLNGLLEPTYGEVLVDGISTKTKNKTAIRRNVGYVFQYPEYQLFEETCTKDIAFGPKNLGLDDDEVDQRVRWACDVVGLDYEMMEEKSPFELSGGQQRRVALAGVLAMKPSFLVLDEPTAGLDPKGRDEILAQISKLHEDRETTAILVSHSMEDVARLCDRIIAIDEGKVFMDASPRELFSQEEKLKSVGLTTPRPSQIISKLNKKGYAIEGIALTVEEAYKLIKEKLENNHEE
ncbi:MAG: energy-coupling factor transporter ATPase [Finegoldia sp.]|nr:energy-coupling factor transporter ATPase [Finegoldia sp.]